MISLELIGEMPSKKNAWKHSSRGGVYLPSGMQKEIDAFLYQIIQSRNRTGLTKAIESPVSVTAVFYGDLKRDLDNITTTLLDILQKANVIKNDKQVFRLSASKCYNASPSLTVQIEPIIIPHAREEDKDIDEEPHRAEAPNAPLKKRIIKKSRPVASRRQEIPHRSSPSP